MCRGLSIDDVGVSRDTVFQKIPPVAGFETADFVEEKLGGATVDRLACLFCDIPGTILDTIPCCCSHINSNNRVRGHRTGSIQSLWS